MQINNADISHCLNFRDTLKPRFNRLKGRMSDCPKLPEVRLGAANINSRIVTGAGLLWVYAGSRVHCAVCA